MKLRYCFIYLLASCLLPALIGCTTAPEELLETEYNNLPYSDGVLVLEQAFSSTSATGTCTSQVIERWYGSDKESRDLLGLFESQLPSKNWMVWPEDVVPIWRKETRDGLFTLAIHTFNKGADIPINQGSYALSETSLFEFSTYPMVYVVTLSYMPAAVARRCFKR